MGIIKRPHIGGAVYILPNLLTTGNLFFGYFSIVKSLQGDYKWAASAIFLAAIFDVLDGRVARLTGGTSEFGVQYDSLCDLVSFGLAPAFLMYQYGLNGFGRIGWVSCFLFLACGALRLARFNVQSSIGKGMGDFTGLPIPMAALAVASFVSAFEEFKTGTDSKLWIVGQLEFLFNSPSFSEYFLLASALLLALAMVSNIAYRSHKVVKIGSIKPFRLLVIFVITTGFVATHPELFAFVFSFVYVFSGPLEWMLGWKKAIEEEEIFKPHDHDESIMEPSDK